MPNAKDFKSGFEKILAVGETGGGKTAGFKTLPGKKYGFIFDPNALNTLKGTDMEYETFFPDLLDINAITLKAATRDTHIRAPEPQAYLDFETVFSSKLLSGELGDYDAILFDSMTTFSDLVMDRILYLNGRFGKWPEQADWTATMNTIANVLRTLVNINATVYVTAHTEFKQDEQTGRMRNIMSLIGRLRNKIPLLFSEVWQFSADTDSSGNTAWFVQTAPDRNCPYLRSTIQGLELFEDITIPSDKWNNPTGEGVAKILSRN